MITAFGRILLGTSKHAITEANRAHAKIAKLAIYTIMVLLVGICFNLIGNGWEYVNIILLYFVLFAIVIGSTFPSVLALLGGIEIATDKLGIINKDVNLYKNWTGLITALLLYLSIFFFIMGTFSFQENIPGAFTVIAGIIVLFLMDKRWDWSTRIAKPFIYCYVMIMLIGNIMLAIPTPLYMKAIGVNPVAWLTISESQKTIVDIDKTKRQIAGRKKNLRLQEIQEKLNTCFKNAKTVTALSKCEEIGTSLEKMREPSLWKESINFTSNSLSSVSAKWNEFRKDDTPKATKKTVTKTKTYGPFSGIGKKGGKYKKGLVVILTIGENVNPGDRVTLIGKNVKMWHKKALRPTKNGYYSFVNRGKTNGDDLAAQAPYGEEFFVKVSYL